MATAPPSAILRLFDGYDTAQLEDPVHRDFVLERLLESGDGDDLCWLFAGTRLPEHETEARDWLAAHGGRRLSRRSRAFWSLVLGTEPSPVAPLDAALWDL